MSKSKVAPSEQLSMEIEQLLSGGGEDVNVAELLGRLAQLAARHLIQQALCAAARPGATGALRGPSGQARPSARKCDRCRCGSIKAGSSGESVRGLRDAALSCSDGLLRVSEAADLESEGANTLTIRRSKTDQEGGGRGPVHRRADGGTGPGVARGPRVRPLATGRRGAVPGRRRGLGRRDADRRPMAIPLDARPLCQGPARRPRRGRQAPLRSVETGWGSGAALQQSRIVSFPVLVR